MTSVASFLSEIEASERLKAQGLPISPATLRTMRVRGGGPIFRKFGTRVRYEVAALDDWAANRLSAPVRSTSELGRAA